MAHGLPPKERPHALVIGSGFGGLAAAVRLGARGYRVTVLERLEQFGGRASVFRQDGFTFDAGPTIITLPQLFEELWALCGRRFADEVDLRPMRPFYRIRFDDGSFFTCSDDDVAMREQVRAFNPADLAGYDAFLKQSEAIYRFAFEEMGQEPLHTWGRMARAVPGFVRHRADRSVYAMVSRYMSDPRLRIAFSFHPLFIGGNPFRVTSLYALVSFLERRYGVHFAMGGTGRLVEGLVDLVKGQGGVLRTGAEVAEILLEEGVATGVRLASGEVVKADVVVSNADSAWTYTRLLPAAARLRWDERKVARSDFSMSLFVWYFGTRGVHPDIDHHMIVLGPRYKGLLDDIFRRKVLADDLSLYVHRPTATDPSLAPPGCDTFYALSPVPHLESGIDWTAQAEPYRRRIQRRLEETILPGLGERVVSSRILTPLDFRDRLSSVHGAAFGLEPSLLQSGWFRPHNVSEDIRNLYLVGAGTHPGAGVPGVLSSARILDRLVPHGETHR
ncbi:MAG: phytoene desaturase [Alsobacter sp.]